MRRFPRPSRFAIGLCILALGLPLGCSSELPVPTATAAQTFNANLAEFTTRLRAGAAARGALVQSLADASAGVAADLADPARDMFLWTQAELDWLEAHRPDACYGEAHRAYREGLEGFAAAATGFADLATRPAVPEAEGRAHAERLVEAADRMNAAETLATAARSICS
jgi:hypothetical protein